MARDEDRPSNANADSMDRVAQAMLRLGVEIGPMRYDDALNAIADKLELLERSIDDGR